MAKQSAFQKGNPVERAIGHIRVAKIEYEYHPLLVSEDGRGTVGEMVDRHLHEMAKKTGAISEFTLVFETPEQQREILNMYRREDDLAQPAY